MAKKDKRITYKKEKLNDFRKYSPKKAEQHNVYAKDKDYVHINYVYERDGTNCYYLSMTHKPPKGKENDYMKLERSVNPKDKRSAYISRKSEYADYHAFGPRYHGYSFTKNDKKSVSDLIKKNKRGK
jgi:hypothetical protein